MTDNTTQFLRSDEPGIAQAAAILVQGGTVAVPTETVYGLAADATNPAAVAKIFSAKQRPNNHPLIVHIHSLEQLDSICRDIPSVARQIAEHFWPGPLTLILKKSPLIGAAVTGELDTIGVRMPAHPVFREILKRGELIVAAPSANPHKQLSPTSAQQVFNELNSKIDAVIDGGACEVGLESTILDISNYPTQPLRILRAGPITAQQLSESLQLPVQSYRSHQLQVPGNIKQHYQPKGRLQVKTTQELADALTQWPEHTACVHYSTELTREIGNKKIDGFVQLSAEKASYARNLYQSLYQLDNQGFAHIWVEQPPSDEAWDDVNDRLTRAQA
ncbi:L-threonylcarbamoyladenylate synthase [Alteromonas flava]|uniref:L-threonylcarbamoyladenylate synthase n=1 Tax=Alteromonas flava TaxID=2048003 RepID=UPI000C28B711|nr:L-threonylcarbamoyladenylate synthase [Alteromonas flava]